MGVEVRYSIKFHFSSLHSHICMQGAVFLTVGCGQKPLTAVF